MKNIISNLVRSILQKNRIQICLQESLQLVFEIIDAANCVRVQNCEGMIGLLLKTEILCLNFFQFIHNLH